MATHAHLMDDYAVGPDPASAWRLPARYYLEPAILELEKERIFFRSWLLAGHVSQLAEPGSYFTLNLLGERLFFVRGEDDEIRGFYNVCRYRAHALVEGSGCKHTITCSYHAWTYGLDGSLRHARNSNRVKGFDPAQYSLVSVRVERFLDFLMFNLDPDAQSFAVLAPALESDIRRYVPRLDELVAQPHKGPNDDATLRCNWKVLLAGSRATLSGRGRCAHARVAALTLAVSTLPSCRLAGSRSGQGRFGVFSCRASCWSSAPYRGGAGKSARISHPRGSNSGTGG